MSNVFLVVDGELLTPDLSDSGVAGIIRDVVIELATQITGQPVSVGTLTTTSLAERRRGVLVQQRDRAVAGHAGRAVLRYRLDS